MIDYIPFPMLGKFSAIISSNIFLGLFSLSSPSGTSIMRMLVHLMLPQRSPRLYSYFFHSLFYIKFCGSDFHQSVTQVIYLVYLSYSSSVGKESTCHAGDPSLIPGSGRFTGEEIGYPLQYSWASLVGQLVKNPPAMWETWVLSLGWEDLLEKGRATHSSILD